MSIIWFKEKFSDLYVTVNKNNLILNKQCENFFSDYAYCHLGYSQEGKKVFVKPIPYDLVDNNLTDGEIYKLNYNRSYVRISCTSFIKTISQEYFIDFTNNKKFSANWSSDKNMLEIDLEKEAWLWI